MSDEQEAAALLHEAKAEYLELGPDVGTLERMLAAVELQTACAPVHAGLPPLWKRLLGLGTGLAVVGALLWAAPHSRPPAVLPRALETAPAPTRVEAVASPKVEVAPATVPERVAPAVTRRPRVRPERASLPDRQDALAELVLLTRARRILRSTPERTLALTDEHTQGFPRGALREERELLAIEALAALGRHEQLRRRAQAFAVAFPASVHLARVHELGGK